MYKKLSFLIGFIFLITPVSVLAAVPELPAPTIVANDKGAQLSWQAYSAADKYTVELSECVECGPYGQDVSTKSPNYDLVIPTTLPEMWVFVHAVDKNGNVIATYSYVQVTNSSYQPGEDSAPIADDVLPDANSPAPQDLQISGSTQNLQSSQVPAANDIPMLLAIAAAVLVLLAVIFTIFNSRRKATRK